MNIVKHVLTERDNATFCGVRLFAYSSGITYLGAAVGHMIHNGAFDYVQFGTGLGIVISTVGAAVTAKATTEVKPQ